MASYLVATIYLRLNRRGCVLTSRGILEEVRQAMRKLRVAHLKYVCDECMIDKEHISIVREAIWLLIELGEVDIDNELNFVYIGKGQEGV